MATPYQHVEVLYGAGTLLNLNTWPGNPGAFTTFPCDCINLMPAKVETVFAPVAVAAPTVLEYGTSREALAEARWVIHYCWGATTLVRDGGANDPFATLYLLQGEQLIQSPSEYAVPLLGQPTAIEYGDGQAASGCFASGHVPIHGRYISVKIATKGAAPAGFFCTVCVRAV